MADQISETPVLDLLAQMTADSFEAARAALDAPPASYLLNLGAASEFDIGEDQVRGVLAAIAPIVGTARIASATGNIVRALAIAIETAEFDED